MPATITLEDALEFFIQMTGGPVNEFHVNWVKKMFYQRFDEDLYLSHIKATDFNFYAEELKRLRPDQYEIEFPQLLPEEVTPPPEEEPEQEEVI